MFSNYYTSISWVMTKAFIIGCFILIIFLSFSPKNVWADGEPKLTNIIVTNTPDDLLLYLKLENAFPEAIHQTIMEGIPRRFTFYISVARVRSMWYDKIITDLEITHELTYNTAKKTFQVVRSWDGNPPKQVKSFAEAEKLMCEIDKLKIAPLYSLEKGTAYQIRAKAELDKKTLPYYLDRILFFISYWDFETDWYAIDFIY